MLIVLLRTLIVYFSLLLIMRLLGKRQLGEMELSEFVLASLIADMAAHPLQDIGIPMINGLIPIVTLFCCEILIAGFSLKNLRLRTLLFGKPSILISRGTIDQAEMRKNRFTLDELMQELRNQGITDIQKIEYAILETNGKLNVIPYPSESPVTPTQLGLDIPDDGRPHVLISDGRLLNATLTQCGLTLKWLQRQLHQHGAERAEDVFLMTVDDAGGVYISIKENTQ